jgi:hypothetical protein
MPKAAYAVPQNFAVNCYALKSIDLSKAKSFATGGFSNCTSLKTVVWPEVAFALGSSATATSGGSVFSNTAIVYADLSKCTLIGGRSFNLTSALVVVDFPTTTKFQIGIEAFKGTSLIGTDIATGQATYFGGNAFQNVTKEITTLDLTSATTIAANAFTGLPLTSVTPPAQAFTLGAGAFEGCDKLTALDLSRATAIGAGALKGSGVTALNLATASGVTFKPIKEPITDQIVMTEFTDYDTANADLRLNAARYPQISGEERNIWGGYTWKSITLDGVYFGALDASLAAAATAKTGVVVSTDGADVTRDKQWVTEAEMAAFDSALAAAQAVRVDADVSQSEVNEAAAALDEAVQTFNAAKKGVTVALAALDAAIAAANAAKQIVTQIADGTDVYAYSDWATAAAFATLDAAIGAAVVVKADGEATMGDINAATATLNAATATFEAAKRPGTKAADTIEAAERFESLYSDPQTGNTYSLLYDYIGENHARVLGFGSNTDGFNGDLVIPETVNWKGNTLIVTTIAAIKSASGEMAAIHSFAGPDESTYGLPVNNRITSLTALSVLNVGTYAFSGGANYRLASIYLPKAERIESSAFRHNRKLINIDLQSAEYIDDYAFYTGIAQLTLKSTVIPETTVTLNLPKATHIGISARQKHETTPSL